MFILVRLSVDTVFCPAIRKFRKNNVKSYLSSFSLQLKDFFFSKTSLESFYQRSKKKCLEKFCSDSSSDCGSSSGSVRASRGSWGSWSSTSSSDGDKKPMITARHFLPSSKFCKHHLCTVVGRVCLPSEWKGLPQHGVCNLPFIGENISQKQ